MNAKFSCRFCKIEFACETFDQIRAIQDEDCFVRPAGFRHELVGHE